MIRICMKKRTFWCFNAVLQTLWKFPAVLYDKTTANLFTWNTFVHLGVIDVTLVDAIWILPIILLFPIF